MGVWRPGAFVGLIEGGCGITECGRTGGAWTWTSRTVDRVGWTGGPVTDLYVDDTSERKWFSRRKWQEKIMAKGWKQVSVKEGLVERILEELEIRTDIGTMTAYVDLAIREKMIFDRERGKWKYGTIDGHKPINNRVRATPMNG